MSDMTLTILPILAHEPPGKTIKSLAWLQINSSPANSARELMNHQKIKEALFVILKK